MNKREVKENIIIIGVTTGVIIACLLVLPRFILGDSITIEGAKEVVIKEKKDNPYIEIKGSENIIVYRTKSGKKERIDLEKYVMGVLSGEMPIDFENEALKAQAIAARTYYMSKRESKCENAKGADICDQIHCQVYMNKEERMAQWDKKVAKKNYEKLEKIVKETEGQVITYENEIIKYPQFFSTSSGKTENSEDIFVSAVPYLKSTESPGESISPKYVAEKTLTNQEFVNIANKKFNANINTNNIKSNVEIVSRTEGGAVEEIKFGKRSVKGTEFRKAYDLNSANFTLEYFKDKVKILMKGSGHGVGMSQWGANVMAKDGKKYEEILKHYYKGIEVKKIIFK
ncbi:MAG: stage II sporulation protein D [Clostridium sp.]|uniref:stage II sporulation protein D n=1 Tax=Clostridium sp. TaxID=1506 RepID=UPI003EE46EC3